MKRYKKLIILLGVLALACVAVFIVSRINVYKENISSTVETIVTIDTDEVTALSWSYGESSFSFHKDTENSTEEESIWLYDDDEAFPVNETKISDLLYSFKEFNTEFTIEDVEDISMYGLDEPMCVITITAGETVYELEFGDYSTMDQERYVSIGDGKVYLASKDPTDSYDLELADMIEDDDIPKFSEVSDVTFAGMENYEIFSDDTGTLSWCSDDIYFTDDNAPFDTSKVTKLLSNYYNMDQDTYVTYNATEEELAQYGLDDPELTMTVNYVSETIESEEEDGEDEKIYSTFVVSLSRSAEDKQAIAEAEESEEETEADISGEGYVRVGQSQIIYKISAADFTTLTSVSYDSLRHEKLFTADFGQAIQVDAEIGGVQYSFVYKENEEDEDADGAFCYGETEISLSDFETALTAIKYSEYSDTAAEGEAEISLKLYLDNEDFPEIDIVLYRYDGTSCRAEVNGQMTGLVSRSSVVDLVETVNAIVLAGAGEINS